MLVSAVISALALDDVSSSDWLSKKAKELSEDTWIDNALLDIDRESNRFYENLDINMQDVRNIFQELTRIPIDENAVKNRAKEALIHGYAHTLLLSACVTSGSLFDDLDYIIDGDTVIIHDAVAGGNGSSELVFDYLTSTESFDISEYQDDSMLKQETRKPKYFDEAFAEYLLPCIQGISDRIFFSGLKEPQFTEISRRYASLVRQKALNENEFTIASQSDTRDLYCSNIGFHNMLAYNLRQAERIREIRNICLHGCPDCISLGNKCIAGGYKEKYSSSKLLLDEYFYYLTNEIRMPYNSTTSEIEALLRSKRAIFLTLEINQNPDEIKRLQDRILSLNGKKLGDSYIKFGGLWVESNLEQVPLTYRYCAILVVV